MVIEILPDGVAQVGCMTLAVVGETGGVGIALMDTGDDGTEVQLFTPVTVKV